eukprot:5527191-Alexandrium_andersonii.AAC.1
MAASSTATKQELEEAKMGGHAADHPKPPRGRSDQEVAPYDSPFYRAAMAGKELSEGGLAAFRRAQGDSAVVSSLSLIHISEPTRLALI